VMFWLSCVQVPVGSEPIMLSAADISERDMTIVTIGGAVVASWALTDAFAGAATASAVTSIPKPKIALPKWSLPPCDARTMHTTDTTLRSRPASAYPDTVVKIRMERRDVEHKEQHSEQSPSATYLPGRGDGIRAVAQLQPGLPRRRTQMVGCCGCAPCFGIRS